MRNAQKYLVALITFGLTLICCAEAFAQLDRSFVATTGTDTEACGDQSSPCRDFNAALSRTNGGGEVIALDSGIYALTNITITKSVTLTAAPGVHADLYNTTDFNRITVDTGGGGLVVLRNLYIIGKPGATNGYGVGVTHVGNLQIENCVIDRFSEAIGSNGMSGSALFFVKDTVLKNSISSGVEINTTSGLVRAVFDHCQFLNNGTGGANGDGLTVSARGRVNVRNSVAVGNFGAGFLTIWGDLSIDSCESSNNDFGVYAGDTATNDGTVTVSNSLVTNNSSYGFRQSGNGVFQSLGNNTVRHNGTNTVGQIKSIQGT